MTFDEVMNRLLEAVPTTIDRRVGSVAYDNLASAALEFVKCYDEAKGALSNTYAGTAEREWLIKKCEEIGVVPYEATYAVRKGIFTPSTLELSVGERFNYEDLNFMILEKLENGVYSLQCEKKGEVGNDGEGTLLPINYIRGLETATLSGEVLVYGEEDEETEALRQRYFDAIINKAMDGNKAQYKQWCNEFPGIGGCKVFPLWKGKNTVKVSILSSENTQASQQLINDFQAFLDPESKGLGEGKAPIGAIVTVATPSVKDISVDAVVAYRAGYTAPTIVQEKIREYLLSLNYKQSLVSYVAISALFLDDPAIELVVDLNVNGGKGNVSIGDEEIVDLKSFTVVEGR